MLKELDVGKKHVASELIKNAPGPSGVEFVIRNTLNRLKNRQRFNNDNNNKNLSLSPLPPSPPSFFSQQPLPRPAPPTITRQQPFLPPPPHTFSPFQPPRAPSSPTFPSFQFPTPLAFPSTDNLFSTQTQTLTREKRTRNKR